MYICISTYLSLSMYVCIYIYIYMQVFTAEGFSEEALESWLEWHLNPRPLNSVQTL